MTRQHDAPRRGPDRSPSGQREAHDPGSKRYGTRSGSGSNEPKHDERKEDRGFVSRQGGDQTRTDDTPSASTRPAEDEP